MKATGIVRRIDELGRVVIPKEIRRKFNIAEGETLEIYVDSHGEVILKKYSPVEKMNDFVQEYADSLYETTEHVACIADKMKIIAIAGGAQKEFINRPLSAAVEEAIKKQKSMIIDDTSRHEYYRGATEEKASKFSAEVIAPIVSEGNPMGAVIIGTNRPEVKLGALELKLAETAAEFIARQIDI